MARAQLCATVTAETTAQLRTRRDAVIGADLVELRVDGVRDLDLEGALAGRRLPVLVTCRPTWEGGRFDGSDEERRSVLEMALKLGAEWVDLEWRGGFEDVISARRGRNIVLSSHDFTGIPADLEQRYVAMRATGAALVKIAVHVQSGSDVIRLLRLGRAHSGDRVVLLGMGDIGAPTRLLPDHFGSAWTYGGEGVAPGQVPIPDMIERYRFHETSSASAIYGVVGAPIGHSLSPSMHNAGFAAADLDAIYIPFEATDPEDIFGLLEALNVTGVSVTAPFKETLMPWLCSVDELGKRVGAVNTLRRGPGGWEGLNTDVPGFLAPLQRGGGVRGLQTTVLGAGGSARAVAVALAMSGTIVTVCARRLDRAKAVADIVDGKVGTMPPERGSWDLLVNSTPVGTAPAANATPIASSELSGGATVYDLVYNPSPTRLLTEAAEVGCRTIGGLDMLAEQAVRQFEWWFGLRPSYELFRRVAEEALRAAEESQA